MEYPKSRWRHTLDGLKSPGFLLALGLLNLLLLIGVACKVHKLYRSHHIMMKGGYGQMWMDDRYDRGGWSQGYNGNMKGGRRGVMPMYNPDAPVQAPDATSATEPAQTEPASAPEVQAGQ